MVVKIITIIFITAKTIPLLITMILSVISIDYAFVFENVVVCLLHGGDAQADDGHHTRVGGIGGGLHCLTSGLCKLYT